MTLARGVARSISLSDMRAPAALDWGSQAPNISNVMHIIWQSRPDLQQVFDLTSADGRTGFANWFGDAAPREYGIDARSVSVAADGGTAATAPRWWHRLLGRRTAPATDLPFQPGAALIGYAHGVLGMGEHVRMTATALRAVDAPFGIVDVPHGVRNRQDDSGHGDRLASSAAWKANIFHVNADRMVPTYCALGPDFFDGHYNIGFWAWELPGWPDPWKAIPNMVDEIWAPSKFIKDCLERITDKPVTLMPLCVELPPIPELGRAAFDLAPDTHYFLYVFDFSSYLERKNPLAAIRAFEAAFPAGGGDDVGLVIKCMNGNEEDPAWQAMQAAIDGDPRIRIINSVLPRAEVLALIAQCDCFVSLHRSEGFGRGPAEAMLLGKPVVATGWSGNLEFMDADSALLVDYRLIDVEPGQYVAHEGQQWADVSIPHAASQMRRCVDDPEGVAEIARRGQARVRDELSAPAIGRRMAQRLREVGAL